MGMSVRYSHGPEELGLRHLHVVEMLASFFLDIRLYMQSMIMSGLCLQISDLESAESFLSEVIRRNRPRVIYFSPHRNPSLRYKLAAFAHQTVADCAFVSTHQSWLNKDVLARFDVQVGEKELLVFKEESVSNPSLHLEVKISIDIVDTVCVRGSLKMYSRVTDIH